MFTSNTIRDKLHLETQKTLFAVESMILIVNEKGLLVEG